MVVLFLQSYLLFLSMHVPLIIIVFFGFMCFYKSFDKYLIVFSLFLVLFFQLIFHGEVQFVPLDSEISIILMILTLSLIMDTKNALPYSLVPVLFILVSGSMYERAYLLNSGYIRTLDYWFAGATLVYGTYFMLSSFFSKIHKLIKDGYNA